MQTISLNFLHLSLFIYPVFWFNLNSNFGCSLFLFFCTCWLFFVLFLEIVFNEIYGLNKNIFN